MYLRIIIFLVFCTINNIFCDDDDIKKDPAVEVHYFKNPKDSSCGLTFGGVMVQLVSVPHVYTDGLFWDQRKQTLLAVDRENATINFYHPFKGVTDCYHFEEFENIEVAAMYPVKDKIDKLVILAGKSVYILTLALNSDHKIQSVKKVFDVTDDSRIIQKSCTTPSGNIIVGTKPSDYVEQLPNVTKGNAEFVIVDLLDETVTTIIDDLTLTGGVAIDYNVEYEYHADEQENKIWRSRINEGSDPELVFDMDDYRDVLSGHVTAITLDRSNHLWIGFLQSFQVIQYDVENKMILSKHAVSVPEVNSLVWGGPKFDILFAGTASRTLDKRSVPAGGAIIAISGTGSKGWYQYEVQISDNLLGD